MKEKKSLTLLLIFFFHCFTIEESFPFPDVGCIRFLRCSVYVSCCILLKCNYANDDIGCYLIKQTMLGHNQYAIHGNPKRGFESIHKFNWQEILSGDFVSKGN